jgi:beta-phosphoglucomutase-like phosphatase (HAD superfamily)
LVVQNSQCLILTCQVIKYILFDCDNTLVLSEHLAFEACTELTNEVLKAYGIDKVFTLKELLTDYVGMNFRGMLVKMQEIYKFTIPPAELDTRVNEEVDRVVAKLLQKAEPCEGAPEQVEKIKQEGKIPMAVVSTSAKPRVIASLVKTGMGNGRYWSDDHVFSAATSLVPPSSKPDPAIYLHACKVLGVKPEEAVAVEDSKSGATAAMRAGIPCIGYVGVYGLEDGPEKMKQMEQVLLEQCKVKAIMHNWSEFQDCLKKVDAAAQL